MLSCSLFLYPNTEKRVFHPISKLWEILYQTRERVFCLVSHHWGVVYSNVGRSDLFDIQTLRNDIPQMRMSVSPVSQEWHQTWEEVFHLISRYSAAIYHTWERVFYRISKKKETRSGSRVYKKHCLTGETLSRMLDIVSQIINNRNVVGWELRISIPKFVRATDLFWCSFMN